MSGNDSGVPERFTLQWHITENCNWRCTHCYDGSSAKKDPSLQNLKEVLAQFSELVLSFKRHRPSMPAHINITGGEPLIHPQFSELLVELQRYKREFSFAILSNGSLIDESMASLLKESGCSFVQVSLEGGEKTNDSIRGRGSFDATIAALRILKKAGMKTLVSFTASRINAHMFSDAYNAALGAGATSVWSDRLIPCGRGTLLSQELLAPHETKTLFETMKRTQKKFFPRKKDRTQCTMGRALQFLSGGEHLYSCTAGRSLLTVMSDGTVYPCRRLPLEAGNCFKDSLENLYRNNHLLEELRTAGASDPSCVECSYGSLCKGGLRCLSQAVYGDWKRKDPGCWL